jgi:5-methyltetrahydropteroyltriglutamate--homocysteine methyltransferase
VGGNVFDRLPVLPTTVVGSYPVPEWMERLKTDYFRGRISRTQLQNVHDMAIKAALRDQELAGIDVVSDGELRRDNDVDYFLARIPGVDIPETTKDFYFDYYDTAVTAPLPPTTGDEMSWLADDFVFTAAQTPMPIKFSFTGPYSLARRIHNRAYPDERDLVLAIAHRLNDAAHVLTQRGVELLQVDEPFLAGYPGDVEIAVEAVNVVTRDVDVSWALHVCYGNRYARPAAEGHYDFLFPTVLEAAVDQLVLEFARKGYADLPVIEKSGWERRVGLGVIDVKSQRVETADVVAARIRAALEFVPAEQLVINPDCGLRNLSGAVARAKLAAMVEGTERVRAGLRAEPASPSTAEPATTDSMLRGA